MQKKYPIKIRVSESLYKKIDTEAHKNKKSKSRYIREQLYLTSKINQKNFAEIINIVENEIKESGIKINNKAHMYNTYGISKIDKDIYFILALVLENEVKILKLLEDFYETDNQKVVFENEPKRKSLTTWISESEKAAIQKTQQEESEKNISVYIRRRLENEAEYNPSSIPPTLNMFNNQIYHILSNINQISYQYEKANINDRKLKYLNANILKLKIIIVNQMEKYYGDYETITYKAKKKGE